VGFYAAFVVPLFRYKTSYFPDPGRCATRVRTTSPGYFNCSACEACQGCTPYRMGDISCLNRSERQDQARVSGNENIAYRYIGNRGSSQLATNSAPDFTLVSMAANEVRHTKGNAKPNRAPDHQIRHVATVEIYGYIRVYSSGPDMWPRKEHFTYIYLDVMRSVIKKLWKL